MMRVCNGKTICMYEVGDHASFPKGVNPNLRFPGTVWKRLKGRVVIGVDEEQEEFQTSDLTGGEKTHSLTIAEMPAHNHELSTSYSNSSPWSGVMRAEVKGGQKTGTSSAGSGNPHNNLPPYVTKFLWERVS